jgi:hypothetical protein
MLAQRPVRNYLEPACLPGRAHRVGARRSFPDDRSVQPHGHAVPTQALEDRLADTAFQRTRAMRRGNVREGSPPTAPSAGSSRPSSGTLPPRRPGGVESTWVGASLYRLTVALIGPPGSRQVHLGALLYLQLGMLLALLLYHIRNLVYQLGASSQGDEHCSLPHDSLTLIYHCWI